MRFAIGVFLALLVVGRSTDAQVGIKETVKLHILTSGLIEITSPDVLALSNVYWGTFIGAPATEPDSAWPRHTVVFDIQTLEGIKSGAYVVYYCSDPDTGEGFIYLPGRGEPPYRRNQGTIIRDEQDGRWHHASAAWSAALNPHLNR